MSLRSDTAARGCSGHVCASLSESCQRHDSIQQTPVAWAFQQRVTRTHWGIPDARWQRSRLVVAISSPGRPFTRSHLTYSQSSIAEKSASSSAQTNSRLPPSPDTQHGELQPSRRRLHQVGALAASEVRSSRQGVFPNLSRIAALILRPLLTSYCRTTSSRLNTRPWPNS